MPQLPGREARARILEKQIEETIAAHGGRLIK